MVGVEETGQPCDFFQVLFKISIVRPRTAIPLVIVCVNGLFFWRGSQFQWNDFSHGFVASKRNSQEIYRLETEALLSLERCKSNIFFLAEKKRGGKNITEAASAGESASQNSQQRKDEPSRGVIDSQGPLRLITNQLSNTWMPLMRYIERFSCPLKSIFTATQGISFYA